MSSAPHGCVAFLRELGDHVIVVARGGIPAVMAEGCPACTRRLAAAAALARGLAIKPPVPSRTDLGVEGVFERAVERFEVEASPIVDALRQPARAPAAEIPWPVQEVDSKLAAALRQHPDSSPVWLDAHLRPRIYGRAARALVSRRAAVLAASVALFALFGWRLGGANGTSTDPEFVFVHVNEMPVLMHPTSVLRHGGGRG